jgi:hypothetical protein
MLCGLCKEARYIVGTVLAIGIHYEHSVEVGSVRDFDQANRNRALMPQITSKADNLDFVDAMELI